jgi:hypothetical protein
MNAFVRVAAACAVVSCFAAGAQAATVFDSYSSYQSGPLYGWGASESAVGHGQISSLVPFSRSTQINSIDWIGSAMPKGGGFLLCVYSDAGAGPQNLIAERVLLARRTLVKYNAGKVVEERYTAPVSLGTSLRAGSYWLSIVGNAPASGWYGVSIGTTLPVGSGGAGYSLDDPRWQGLVTTFYTSPPVAMRLQGVASTAGSGVPALSSTGKCLPGVADVAK